MIASWFRIVCWPCRRIISETYALFKNNNFIKNIKEYYIEKNIGETIRNTLSLGFLSPFLMCYCKVAEVHHSCHLGIKDTNSNHLIWGIPVAVIKKQALCQSLDSVLHGVRGGYGWFLGSEISAIEQHKRAGFIDNEPSLQRWLVILTAFNLRLFRGADYERKDI